MTHKWLLRGGKLMLVRISLDEGVSSIDLYADGGWVATDDPYPLSPGAAPWRGAPDADDEDEAYRIMRRAGVSPEDAQAK